MSTTPRRILILDDNYESMAPFKVFLEQVQGYQVELTAAAPILERLRHERFDLIIADIMIQSTGLDEHGQDVTNIHFAGCNWQTTGIEFLKRLRSGQFAGVAGQGTDPNVPTILLSAVAQYSVGELLDDSVKPARHIEKPFRLEELLSAISAILGD